MKLAILIELVLVILHKPQQIKMIVTRTRVLVFKIE